MNSEADDTADRLPQYSLRQLWIAVSIFSLLLGIPLIGKLVLWLALQVGLTAAMMLVLIAVQTACFLLFRAIRRNWMSYVGQVQDRTRSPGY